ncbi:uncharacterized protein LOC117474988, partial [Scomber scombrus]
MEQPTPADPLTAINLALDELNQPQSILNSLNHFHTLLDTFSSENALSNEAAVTPLYLPPTTAQSTSLTGVSHTDRLNALDTALLFLENDTNAQTGGNITPENAGTGPQAGSSNSDGSPTMREISRSRFNNIEIRQILQFPMPAGVPDYGEFYGGVMGAAHELCDKVFSQAHDHDVIQMELRSDCFTKSVSSIVRPSQDDSGGLVTFQNLLDELVQSNMALMTDGGLELVVQLIRNPRGGSKRRLDSMIDSEVVKKRRKFLYVVENPDNRLCFAINLALLLNPYITDGEAERKGREIQRAVGLSEQTDVGFTDVSLFENYLDCKIVVFYRSEGKRSLCKFLTATPRKDKTVFLFLHQNHYYDCNRTCRSTHCMSKHKERVQRAAGADVLASQCDLYKQCGKCFKLWYTGVTGGCKPHVCLKLKCKICGTENLPDNGARHLCYIQPLKVDTTHTSKIVFYDFETYADRSGLHVPFLVCTKTLEGVRWKAKGESCARQFIKHFRSPAYARAVFIAHNSRGFDSYLILNAMLELGIKPSLIMQGSKVICFTEPDYAQRYIDSLSFLTMPLATLPQALGFEDKIKGYFPHAFSSQATLKYKGCYPPSEAYCVNRMTSEGKRKFECWYETVSGGVFDFEKEALRYCQNDVDILSKACTLFRNGFLEETGVDPFSRATIASACMKVFCTRFLVPETLALPPADHYRRQFKSFSHCSIQWLEWLAQSKGVFIRHALNAGEKQLGPYFVDGYSEHAGDKCVYEFLGCFYHGCAECFQPADECPLTHRTFEDLHSSTMKRLEALQSLFGVRVVVMREHTWRDLKRNNAEVRSFLER